MKLDYSNRKYSVVPYNSAWKDRFREIAEIVQAIFGDSAIAIEHVGSTSVPELSGKPVIDVLIIVENITVADTFKGKMEEAGFSALGEYLMPDSRFFMKEVDGERLCNLHIFPKDHSHVKEMLQLRDYFRNHPETVEEYSKLKIELFQKYPEDYGSYRKYKDEWMEKLKKNIKPIGVEHR
jgi:GrpB-like predicted nucleotidyltransferase (UPF0157 family)